MRTSRIWVSCVTVLSLVGTSISAYAQSDPAPQPVATSPVRVYTLAEFERIALAQQPQMLAAQAQTRIAQAGSGLAWAPLLPQVTGVAQYTRETGNYVARPGAIPTTTVTVNGKTATLVSASPGPSLSQSYDYWNLGLTATQLIYDFGQTYDKYRSARDTEDAQRATEAATRFVVLSTVRGAYFTARSNKDLVEVAKENLSDQEKHLTQVEGMVRVGTQPLIAQAQQKSAVATARVQLVTAQNTYDVSKTQLNQAAGIRGGTEYELSDEDFGPVAGEDQPLEPLLNEALKARPEMASFAKQQAAQEDSLASARGSYGPTFSAAGGLTAAGTALTGLVPNWSAGLVLTWPVFQGGLTVAEVHQAEASLSNVDALEESQLLQIQTQVDTARLAVRAAKASVGAAEDALLNAREQLRLAEQRYSTGVGSIIELGDAQVARTTAAAQLVQARYGVSSARAQLLAALGRP